MIIFIFVINDRNMRKFFIVIFMLAELSLSATVQAQVLPDSLDRINSPSNGYKWGLGAGISIDNFQENFLSAKYFLSPKSALQFTAGNIQKPLLYSLLFERHHFILHSRKLRFIYGAGITMAVTAMRRDVQASLSHHRLNTYLTLQGGFEYNLHKLPIALGADGRISLYRQNAVEFSQGRLNRMEIFAHYTFGKR